MTDQSPEITRANELLKIVRHAAMATVNPDGSPHNTPFFFLHDDALTKVYWGSHPASQHSQNIVKSGQLFIVLYEADKRGGLYIRAVNGHELSGVELEDGLAVHNAFRKKEGQEPIQTNYYTGNSPQRMWSANLVQFWVNAAERSVDGHLIKDFRREITTEDLIK